MKTINVCFKDIKLGELIQVKNNYVYKANSKNVDMAHKKGYSTYLYQCDESFISEELPFSLQNFLPDERQKDLIYFSGIIDSDNDFEKLYKIAKLDFEKPDFYITV